MSEIIRIGSRDSALATWQAEEVQRLLAKKKVRSEIIFIKSHGDLNQDKPLHQMGMTGLFTKALDDALLEGKIDIAVHSCKDLPSVLHDELCIFAHLEREDPRDALVGSHQIDFLHNKDYKGTIATGSVRRKAQLLAHFPHLRVVGLRGNVPTRLDKLRKGDWDGAVFASAGLKRLNIEPEHIAYPHFMVSAPAQGVVVVVGKKNDASLQAIISEINHSTTALTTTAERDFLRLMEGGCITPIGAFAEVSETAISMKISVMNNNGSERVDLQHSLPLEQAGELGQQLFEMAIEKGAKTIIENLEREQ